MPSTPGSKRGQHLKRKDAEGHYRRPNWPAFRAGRGARFLAPLDRTGRPVGRNSATEDAAEPTATSVSIGVIVRGTEVALSPYEFDQLDLYDLEEIGRPTSYPDMTNRVGKVPILTDRGYHHVWVESDLEADHLLELQWAGVDELNTQCFELRVEFSDGTLRTRRPDGVVRRDGRTTVVDITAECYLDDEKARSYDLAADMCAAAGWGYEVGTDRTLSAVRRANLNYLTMCEDIDVEPLPGPRPRSVGELVDAYGGGPQGHQLAYGALWHRRYWLDMTSPLEDTSRLTKREPGPVRFTWGAP